MKKVFIMLAVAILSLHLLVPADVQAQEAKASLVIEAGSGCILSEQNADVPLPVGTLAKLMTAYLTAEKITDGTFSTDSTLTAGESVRSMQGAVIWLEPGDSITVEELLLGLIVGNANDAAAVLADAVSGDAAHFVMDMNAAAFDLGMRSTHFTSPQGFDDPGAFSTAHDIGLLACAVLRCECLQSCLRTWRTFIRNNSVELVNENTLTRTLDNCHGLKAAHSPDAGQCVAAACECDGMLCVAVILGCPDESERFSAAESMLRESFRSYQLAMPGFSEEFLRPLTVKGGRDSAVLLQLPEQPLAAVPRGTGISAVIVLPEFVEAPVRHGQRVGRVCFYSGSTLLSEAPLLAGASVEKISFSASVRVLLHHLFG